MAGIRSACVTGEITTGTSVKTLLQIIAPTNQRLLVKEASVSFKGIVSTGTPAKVDILRQTTAGTMTSLTPVKWNSADDETLQITAQHTSTSEPTAGDVLWSEEVHPQTGYTWQAPFGMEFVVPGGTRLGLRVTTAETTSAIARMIVEE